MDVPRIFRHQVKWTAALAGIALLVLAVPAEARPLSGEGTGEITSIDIEVIREAGGNVTQVRQLEGSLTGTIDGTFVETVTGVVHKSGRVTFRGTLTFTGTVADCGEGTFTVGVTGRAQSGLPTADATFRVINQAANTLGITGTGTLSQVGTALTYEVAYIC
jgi:hypothetical protein